MKLIYYLSLLPLVVIAYIISEKINNHFSKDIEETRELISNKREKKLRTTYQQKLKAQIRKNRKLNSHYKKIELYLIQKGNPYKLTPITYYILKIVPSTIVILLMIYRGRFSILIAIVVVFLFFFVDIEYYLSNRNDEAEIRKNLPNIYNILETQTYAGIQLDQALIDIHDIVTNKRLKNAFIDMSAEIITKRNMPNALENFKNKFKMIEIDSFVLTIKQGISTGKIREMLSNQRKVLYKTYLNSKDIDTSKNEYKVVIALVLLFVSSGMVVMYSYMYQIIDKLDFILK